MSCSVIQLPNSLNHPGPYDKMNNPALKQKIQKSNILFLSILHNHLNIRGRGGGMRESPTPFTKMLILYIHIGVEPPFVVAKATNGIVSDVGLSSDDCSAGDITLLRFLLNRMKRTFFLNLFTLLGIR